MDGTRSKVGVFGGTFDPPHLGHRSVALDVADALELDQVLWIPAGDPPHKRGDDITPAWLRLRMVRAVTMLEPRFGVSEVEVNRSGPSFTVDTLRTLKRERPDSELYLILGIDQYRTFESWREPEEILALASLAVMDRAGQSLDSPSSAPGMPSSSTHPSSHSHPPSPHFHPSPQTHPSSPNRVLSVPVRRIDISSTRVRAAAERGESILHLVPQEVARIIEAEGLYRRDGA